MNGFRFTWLCLLLGISLLIVVVGCNEEEADQAVSACNQDEDCEAGQFCANNRCRTQRTCTTASDCLIDEFCLDGQCQLAQGCTTWEECPESYDCVDGYCLPPNTDDPTGCEDDNDCLEDEYCDLTLGICTERPTDGDSSSISCSESRDCPDGSYCQDGKCTPWTDSDGDSLDGDLSDGDVIDGDIEYLNGALCEPCERDADCNSEGALFNLCLQDLSGEFYCGRICDDETLCPVGYGCSDIFAENGSRLGKQCRPASGYCDRCASVTCPERMVCSESTGECEYQGNHCHVTGCPAGAQCNEETGSCDYDPTHCVVTGCDEGFTCNEQTGDCELSQDNCRNTGCNPGYDCDWNSGQCEVDPTHCVHTGCDSGFSCNTTSGVCEPSSEDCTETGCSEGYVCNQQTGECELQSSGGGYCDWCEGQEDCEGGAACINNSETFDQYCSPGCDSHADCPNGSACRNVVGWNTCIPNTMSCNLSHIGGSCEDAYECESGTCLLEFPSPNIIWPRGMCTQVCDTNNPILSCPENSYCLEIEYNYYEVENLCIRICTLGDSTTCRGDYVCYDIGFGTGEGLCITGYYPF